MRTCNHTLTASKTSNDRIRSSAAFLEKSGWGGATVTFLAGDASFRKYYRLSLNHTTDLNHKTALLMDAPLPENPQQFCDIAALLQQYGLSAPHIYAVDFEQGFVLLEDFGDQTYTTLIKQGVAEQPLYTLAVDALIHLHRQATLKPTFIPHYDQTELHREVMLFLEWYWPQHKNGHKSRNLPTSSQIQTYQDLWTAMFNRCTGPQTLVLRDYHVDNLMLLTDPAYQGIQQCGLLDFQDALWGSITYDLVSLCQDARRDVDPTLIATLWDHYFAAFPHLNTPERRQEIMDEACILSAARHVKILGIFTRLAIRDQKNQYLQHLPRVWMWLKRCLENPVLAPLSTWFHEHFPQEMGAPYP